MIWVFVRIIILFGERVSDNVLFVRCKQAENGLQSRSGWHGLSWMTLMDDCHGHHPWMTLMDLMDDFHGWLSWMTGMDYPRLLMVADLSYFHILFSYGLTDRQTDLHWYLLSRYRDWKDNDKNQSTCILVLYFNKNNRLFQEFEFEPVHFHWIFDASFRIWGIYNNNPAYS